MIATSCGLHYFTFVEDKDPIFDLATASQSVALMYMKNISIVFIPHLADSTGNPFAKKLKP